MSVGGDIDWVAVQQAMQRWVVVGSGLPATSVVWGQQDAPRPAGPAILLRISNQAELGMPWSDTQPNPLTFAALTVTSVNSSADTLTSVAHGLLTGDGPVQLETAGTLPAPLALLTNYWVIVVDADHVKLAETYVNTGGGQGSTNPTTPIDLTDAGFDNFTIAATAATVRAGQEMISIARGIERVTLELRCHASTGVGINMATAILQRVRRRRVWPSQRAALDTVNIALMGAERVRAILGIRDALLFEPRAMLELHFCVVDEESDPVRQTVIETAKVTDQTTNATYSIPLIES